MTSGPRVKHLWDCAIALDTETHSKKLLRSYLINTCRNIAGTNENIPLERFASSQMCQRCSIHWQENEFQMKLKPQTIDIKTSRVRQLISKLKTQQSNKQSKLLTKKQKKRAKWLLKHAESKMEIKCGFCQHKTLISLNKDVKASADGKHSNTNNETPLIESSKGKKKKKNRDTTAGLKIPKPKKDNSQENIETKNKIVSNSNAKSTQLPSLNLKKQKTKNQSKKEAPKVQSKTQKQNSLLQLAAMLKLQDSTKTKSGSSTKNRLESLLE